MVVVVVVVMTVVHGCWLSNHIQMHEVKCRDAATKKCLHKLKEIENPKKDAPRLRQ